jgi:hypothetical protein
MNNHVQGQNRRAASVRRRSQSKADAMPAA